MVSSSNKALLSDWFSAALQTSRKARRYAIQVDGLGNIEL